MTEERRPIYPYFVDRDDELKSLHRAINGVDIRAMWIVGEFGIGKTKILNELKADLQKQQVRVVHIDLSKKHRNLGYMFVITETRNDLGRSGFEPVSDAIWELNPTDNVPQPSGTPAQLEQLRNILSNVNEAKPGRIEFHQDADIKQSQLAGNAILNWNNYYGHQRDQDWITDEISLIFRDCLFAVSQQERLIFIIDHWEKATGDLQSWFEQYLLAWCLDQDEFNAVIFLGCEHLPDWYEEREDVQLLPIGNLPEEAVHQYWVLLRKLPPESLGIQNSANLRNPSVLARCAQDVAMQLEQYKSPSGHD